MRRSELFIIASTLSVSILSNSCSLKAPSQTPLHIEIPRSTELSRSGLHSRAQSTAANYTTAPTSLSDFDCFAVNVTAPEIPAAPQPCTIPSDTIGIGGGWISANSSSVSIDLMVPSGLGRLIQIYGVRTPDQCPLLGDFKSARLGDIYLIGSVTQDIFDDTNVSINAHLDTSKKALTSCRTSAPIDLGTTTYYVLGPSNANEVLPLPNNALYTLTSVSTPLRGNSTVSDNGSHINFNYNPSSNTGIDQFTYTAVDSSGMTGTGNIIIKNVTPTTWTGEYGDHLWSNPGNWCGSVNGAHSACSNTGPVPTTMSVAVFDGTCSSANCSATIDSASVMFDTLYLDSDYPGTLTQSSSNTNFQITNMLHIRGGTILVNNVNNSFYNSGQLILDGGHLIAGSGSMSLGVGNGINISSGLLDLSSSVSVSLGTLSIMGGTLHAPEGGTVTYNGTIHATGGTINSGANTSSTAILNNPNVPLTIDASPPLTFQKLILQSTGSSGNYTVNGSIYVVGKLTLNGMYSGAAPSLTGGSINVQGDLTVDTLMSGYSGSTPVLLNGTGAQTITTSSSAALPMTYVSSSGNMVINNSSPLTLQSVAATTVEHTGTGALTLPSGTLYVGTFTQNGSGIVNFAASTLNGSLHINSSDTCNLNGALTITGSLTMDTLSGFYRNSYGLTWASILNNGTLY